MPAIPGLYLAALVSNEREVSQMKRVIIFTLVLLGALAPVVGVAYVAEARWDTACHCDVTEAP